MSYLLLPDVLITELTELTPEYLTRQNIKLLMLDFDNTIVPYTTDIPTQKMMDWFAVMLNSNIQLCVVSNSKRSRVVDFCRKYGIPCITHAKKPSRKGVQKCLTQFDVPPAQAALVGDQIYTDTLCANRAGVRAILVKAIDNHNFLLKARHVAELPFIYAAKRRSEIHEKH